MSIDYFGYLSVKGSFSFDGGEITVLDDYDKANQWIEKYLHKDGYVYPPISRSIRFDPLTMEEKGEVPHTERPALLHNLPRTHSIEITNKNESIEDMRKGSYAFIINILSYLFGTRLQFHDWFLDGRIPINVNNGFSLQHETVEHFLSHTYKIWESWDEDNQKLITNVLYMFCRSAQYEWDWEQFTIRYMVIDGLWKIYQKKFSVDNVPHRSRIIEMCKTFEIPIDNEHLGEIIELRNTLFHESLWDKEQPCYGGSNAAFYKTHYLRNLISRLIPAILGYETSFVKSAWWHISQCYFDKRED